MTDERVGAASDQPGPAAHFDAALHRTLHWLTSLFAALLLWPWRLLSTLWPRRAPRFWSDWQRDPPHPPGAAPEPPIAKRSGMDVLGIFTGTMMSGSLEAAEVRSVLPPGLVLPPGSDGRHPVTIAFGYQEDVHPRGLGWLPGSSYLELVVGIPDLYLAEPVAGFRGPCAVLGRLCLNRLLPTVLGRLMGYPKVLTRTSTDHRSFLIQPLLGSEDIGSGAFEPQGPIGWANGFPGFESTAASFAQPVVSRSLLGTIVFTGFHWHWHEGVIQDVTGKVRLSPGLGCGEFVWELGRAIRADGAWRIHVPWAMRGPYPLARLAAFELRVAAATASGA